MRTKQVWHKRYKTLWKCLPETGREWYWLNGQRHIAIRQDAVLDLLWHNNGYHKFTCNYSPKRTEGYNSLWL